MSRLEILGITKRFADTASHAVRDVSFSVESNQIAALVGESGAGKSTLLRLVAGLEQPDAGEIRLDGLLLSSPRVLVPPERRGIGFVFQNHALFPHLSVSENVTFGLRNKSAAVRQTEAARLLELVKLGGCGDRMPHELSGGERQRVALARTLAPRPGLVLLDEPFSSLDATLKAGLRAEMQVILRRLGVAALMVTHDKGDALALADRIAVIRSGRIEQVGGPAELYARPASRYVAAFFGECNFMPARAFARVPPVRWSNLYRSSDGSEAWIRPANLELVSPEAAVAEGGMVGRIAACRFAGEHWDIRFRPDDADIPQVIVHAPRTSYFAENSRVGLLPLPAACPTPARSV